MQVRLSAPLQQFVRQLVADGDFASETQVIAAALKFFAREQLRREIEVGLADIRAGRVSDWDVEEAKRDLLRRVKRKKKPS
jgi:Arc/MetJ-type ribon-helix-helix transcriptional regulator